jgi:hypothetical protein
VWEGAAAEAAQERAFADLVKVRGLADVLHESAAIARRGADTLYSAKQSVLDAVKEASAAGCMVNDNLSVTPRRSGVAAQAEAQVYAAQIQERAVQLAVHDKEIATKIAGATAPLHAVTFVESPSTSPRYGVGMAGFGTPPPEDPAPPWQPPPPPYPQGQPVGPGLPPEGVRPPVDGPLTTGPASKPSIASQGGQSLWDRNGGEWRYDSRYDINHYPHWDYNPHARKFDEWKNVGIDGLPTHTGAAAPPRSGTVGPPPPAAAPPPPVRPAPPPPPAPVPPPAAKAPTPRFGGGVGGGPPIGPHVIPPPHAHQHWAGETPEDEWADPNH